MMFFKHTQSVWYNCGGMGKETVPVAADAEALGASLIHLWNSSTMVDAFVFVNILDWQDRIRTYFTGEAADTKSIHDDAVRAVYALAQKKQYSLAGDPEIWNPRDMYTHLGDQGLVLGLMVWLTTPEWGEHALKNFLAQQL